MDFLTLIAIFGLVAAIRWRWQISVEFLPLVVITSVVIALYFFAFAGVLRPVAYLIFAAGLFAIPFLWILDKAGLRRVMSDLCAPAIVVFFGGAVAYRLFFDGIQFYSCDTFAHWGYATQELLYFHDLDRSSSNNLESDYPPGINLFHYFVLFLSQNTEDRIYFANFMLLASPLVTLLRGVRLRQIHRIALLSVLGYLFASTFGVSFRDLPPDHTLGLLFAGAVLYFLGVGTDEPVPFSLFMWGLPAIAILPLIKESGILLAMIAAGVAAVDSFWRYRAVRGSGTSRFSLTILLLFVAPLATWSVWNSYVSSSVAKKTFAVDSNTAVIAWDAIVTGERNAIRQKTIESFIDAMTHRTIGQAETGAVLNRFYWQMTGQWKSGEEFPTEKLIPQCPVSVAVLFVVFVVLAGMVVILTANSGGRRRVASVFVLLFAGGGIYLLALLVLYLSAFGAGVEAQEVRYFGRYVGTYVVAVGVVLLALMAGLMADVDTKRIPSVTLLLCMVAMVFVTSRMSVSILLGISPEHSDTRQLIQARTAYVKKETGDNASVYVVWQVTSGYEHRILHYDLLPRFTNRECWSFGPPGQGKGCGDGVKEWTQRLEGFDFVLLAKTDDYFRTRFTPLFTSSDVTAGKYLYKVIRDTDGKLVLTGR